MPPPSADVLGRSAWPIFSQIRTKDHDTLPAVLTITTTMIYLHLPHQRTRDALQLMDQLCQDLPR